MSGKAARILLSEKQHEILQIIVKSTTGSFRLIQRARIILLSFKRVRNDEIASEVGLSRKQVGLWRRRWKQSFDALVSIECREPHAVLRRTIEDVLSDAPRAGAHGKFTAEQMTQIMAIACESPEQSGRPVDHWTHRELADEAKQRGFVPSISASQVGRYWCEARELTLHQTEPTLVAFYIEELGQKHSRPTVKQHLAAIRMLFDYFVTGGILKANPSSSVRGPKHVVVKGKTPVLQPADARHLLDSIPTDTIGGLRDRALISLMLYTFARVGAAVAVDIGDIQLNGRRYFVRLREKGGRQHEMPLHHTAEEAILAYMDAGDLHGQKNMSLFRTLDRRRNLTENRMLRQDALSMVKRRARDAELGTSVCNHSMRASGITAYMMNGGTLERAQQMAAHASSRTTSLYNRANDSVTLDEVERILI